MGMSRRSVVAWAGLGAAVAVVAALLGPGTVGALEVGQPAPEFKLPSTNGDDISLSDFKGKKWVFLEFYGIDFQPT